MVVEDFLEGKKSGRAPRTRGSGSPAGRAHRIRRGAGRLPLPLRRKSSSSPSLPLRLPPTGSPSASASSARRTPGAARRPSGSTARGSCRGSSASTASLLKRNSYEQAFQDPQLVPVAFEKLRPGDLLFFGTEDKIDHEAMWIGDGTVLQSTRHDVPGVQVTPFDSPFLKPLFRYARRLKISSTEEAKISSNGRGRRRGSTRRKCAPSRPHSRQIADAQRGALRHLRQGSLDRPFPFQESLSLHARRLHDEDARPPRGPAPRGRGDAQAHGRAAR